MDNNKTQELKLNIDVYYSRYSLWSVRLTSSHHHSQASLLHSTPHPLHLTPLHQGDSVSYNSILIFPVGYMAYTQYRAVK